MVLKQEKILYNRGGFVKILCTEVFSFFNIIFPGIKVFSQKASLLVLQLLKHLTTKFGMVWCGSNLVKTPGRVYFKESIFNLLKSCIKSFVIIISLNIIPCQSSPPLSILFLNEIIVFILNF